MDDVVIDSLYGLQEMDDDIFISNAMIAGGNQAKSCGLSDKTSTFESKF